MKNFMTWFKAHWPIVLLGVIAIAALPALWIVSSGMRAKRIEEFQKRVETDWKDVSASKINYQLPSPTGDTILVSTAEASKARIDAYQAIGEQLQAQTSVVSKAALDLNSNSGAHKVLIGGLFPSPSDLEKLSKPKDFARAIIERERPRLLKIINAGMPPSPTVLAEQLNQIVQDRISQIRTEHGRTELDSKEREDLAKELLNARLATYQVQAASIQVYADVSIFDEIPSEYIDTAAPLNIAWDWQERLWIHEDMMRVVAATNGDSGRRGTPGSVVKRIKRIEIDSAPFAPAGSSGGSGGTVNASPFEAGTDRAPSDLSRSITGRISGPGSNNKWYDVRYITIEMVADATRLPAFVDALASVNFMTVVDTDLVKVDSAAELREGFFYGDAPVVNATLVIESVWFREWRERWMPVEVKQALGMDPSAPAADVSNPSQPARRGGGGAAAPRPLPDGRDGDDFGDVGGRRRGGGGG